MALLSLLLAPGERRGGREERVEREDGEMETGGEG